MGAGSLRTGQLVDVVIAEADRGAGNGFDMALIGRSVTDLILLDVKVGNGLGVRHDVEEEAGIDRAKRRCQAEAKEGGKRRERREGKGTRIKRDGNTESSWVFIVLGPVSGSDRFIS